MDEMHALRLSLHDQVAPPPGGIVTRVVYEGARVHVTLCALDAGQSLPEQSASWSVIIEIHAGEANLTIGGETRLARPGTWLHVPAHTPYRVYARTPLVLLVLLLRDAASTVGIPEHEAVP